MSVFLHYLISSLKQNLSSSLGKHYYPQSVYKYVKTTKAGLLKAVHELV